MTEIEFSVIEGALDEATDLLPLLRIFEKEHHIHVNVVPISWAAAWAQNVKYAIYGHGPDVSMVGASWIGSLAAMQALRPFTMAEIQALGGVNSYFDSIWQLGLLTGSSTPWAVPWLGDVRLLFYWKDELKKAGIENFAVAFKNDDAFKQTLAQLSINGYEYPLAITTQAKNQILHEAAHWVWSAGGDFVSPDGKRVLFNQPKALAGLKNYFGLLPYINPDSMQADPARFFNKRSSPVHIAGLWVMQNNSHLKDNLGVAKLPGVAYVGGTSLVVWRHTLKAQAAFELIRFLSDQPLVYNTNREQYYKLPTRCAALNTPMTLNDSFNQTSLDAFQTGRGFPTMRLWGSIQEKLIVTLANIWSELFLHPNQDLDICLRMHLNPLADRLDIVLGN